MEDRLEQVSENLSHIMLFLGVCLSVYQSVCLSIPCQLVVSWFPPSTE